jgi:hypothetical protein
MPTCIGWWTGSILTKCARCAPSHSKLLRPRRRVLRLRRGHGPEPKYLLADEPVRDFSFIGLFNGAPDVSERSEEILREEFTKRADADR